MAQKALCRSEATWIRGDSKCHISFSQRRDSGDFYILFYIDDLLIAEADQPDTGYINCMLRLLYGIREIGRSEWFFAINFDWITYENGPYRELSQRQAIKQFLEDDIVVWRPVAHKGHTTRKDWVVERVD